MEELLGVLRRLFSDENYGFCIGLPDLEDQLNRRLNVSKERIGQAVRILERERTLEVRRGFAASPATWAAMDAKDRAAAAELQVRPVAAQRVAPPIEPMPTPVADIPHGKPAPERWTWTCRKCGHSIVLEDIEGHTREEQATFARAWHDRRAHAPKPEGPATVDPAPDHPRAARRLPDRRGRKVRRFPYVVECYSCGARRGILNRGARWTPLRVADRPHEGVHEWHDVTYLYHGGKPPSPDRTRPDRRGSG